MVETNGKHLCTHENKSAFYESSDAFLALYHKIIRIDLKKDNYELIKIYADEETEEAGFCESFSLWVRRFALLGFVHPYDVENFLEFTELSHLINYFKNNKSPLCLKYRRKTNGVYKWAAMELTLATDSDKSVVLLCVHDIYDKAASEPDEKSSLLLIKDAFYKIACIDLKKNSMKIISSTGNESDDIEDIYGFEKDYQASINKYINKYVLPQYREYVLNILAPEKLEKLLDGDVPYIDITYRRLKDKTPKWFHLELIPISGYNSENKKVMLYLRNISVEKALEEKLSKKLLKENTDMNLRLDTILNSIPGGLKISSDTELLNYAYVSRAAAAIQGYTVDEFLKVTDGCALKNVYPEDKDRFLKELTNAYNKGARYSIKYRVKCKNGSIKWILDSGKRVIDEDGEIFHYSLYLDITDLEMKNIELKKAVETEKNLNELLNEEKKQYRNALNKSCEYVFPLDITEGIINDKFFGKDGTDILKSLGLETPVKYDVFADKCYDTLRLHLSDNIIYKPIYRENLLSLFKEGVKTTDFEYHNPVTDKHIRVLIIMFENEENGHIKGLACAQDITEFRRNEEKHKKQLLDTLDELKTANTELDKALQSERAKLSFIEAISKIYFCSYYISVSDNSFKEISSQNYIREFDHIGGNAQDPLNHWAENIVCEEFRDDALAFVDFSTLSERLKGHKILSFECKSKIKGWIRISFISSNANNSETPSDIILVAQNINAEKQKELDSLMALKDAYEAANQANTVKSRFLANMSHDIRTPMNAIIGLTAIAKTRLNDKNYIADVLNKITVSGNHLMGLINEILDMTKIESGKFSLNEGRFSISDLVDSVITIMKPQAADKKHSFLVNINDISHENVIGDYQRLQQAFINILGNAIKYTPDGGKIEMTISEIPTDKPKFGYYKFIFKDNGIGMSKDFLKILFEPFARAKNVQVEKIQGAGLGMPIAKNIIQMMNGDIQVKSEPDKGSEFTVSLLLKLSEDNDLSFDFKGLSVLVADSDPSSGNIACNILKELEMNPVYVCSKEDALNIAIERHNLKNDFFAVIMPAETDNVSIAGEIRRSTKDGVPFIIISDYDCSETEADAKKEACGADAFISKPLLRSKLSRVFTQLVKRKKAFSEKSPLEAFSLNDYSDKRILLVEDNELNAEIAGEIFGMAKIKTDYAKNGQEAVDIMKNVKDNYYDIIFMDIKMPVMNGYEATKAIRSMPGDYAKNVPIIAVSANTFTDDITEAIRSGMNEHISKPLDINQLIKVFHKWIIE